MSSPREGDPTAPIAPGQTLRVLSVQLVVLDGPDRGRRVRVKQGALRVGSASGNALCLSDRTVSRLHCEVTVEGNAARLRDCGSMNGTFVDGRRVHDIELTTGTIVRVGGTTFCVEFDDTPAFLELSQRTSFGDVVGASAAMRRVYAILEKAAASDATVLLLGETGTGKEMVAFALHEESPRARGPFVTVDCGAIPENLIESELFGHVRGAFTGALTDRKGAFEEADGGTLFFDEIGELPITMQPKLLRALEGRVVRRVGSNAPRKVDVRVIAATHRPLAQNVNLGSFREDLYYRLAVIEIELPPLRARRDDIPFLAAHFIERFSKKAEPAPPALLSSLLTRDWPGNVRELRNFIERSVSLGWTDPRPLDSHASARADLPPGIGALVPTHLQLKDARFVWIEQFENVYIRALLDKTGGNVTQAARMGGVSRRFLQRAMIRLGIRQAEGALEDDRADAGPDGD